MARGPNDRRPVSLPSPTRAEESKPSASNSGTPEADCPFMGPQERGSGDLPLVSSVH